MMPRSYDHVSEKTKHTVQLIIARASFLRGRGSSDGEANATMAKVKEDANRGALERAVAAWKRSRQPCTAEQLVQWFAGRVWKAVVRGDDRVRPPRFKTRAHEGPLSTEFLEAVGITSAEARGICQLKNKTRGKDPSTSSGWLVGQTGWSGAPLTAQQFKLMDAGLMETIWEARIYRGDNEFHDAGPFAVMVPKDKAWLALGEDFKLVQKAILNRWWPLRIYTCDLGHNLQVGLWVPKLLFRDEAWEMLRYKIEELYNILRHWEFQVRGTGMQSLVACLAGYLVEAGVLRLHA